MSRRLVFRPQAAAELVAARAWYEGERVGLGAIFTAAVETTVAAILENPLAYPRVKGDTRRAIVRRFPYATYFCAMDAELVVLAVMQPESRTLAVATLSQLPAGADRRHAHPPDLGYSPGTEYRT